MILLWPEGKLLARMVFYLSESCELFLRFLCSGHCLEQFINKIIADSAKQYGLRMRSSLFTDSPSSFSVCILSGFARFRIKGVRISEVLLYFVNFATIDLQ